MALELTFDLLVPQPEAEDVNEEHRCGRDKNVAVTTVSILMTMDVASVIGETESCLHG